MVKRVLPPPPQVVRPEPLSNEAQMVCIIRRRFDPKESRELSDMLGLFAGQRTAVPMLGLDYKNVDATGHKSRYN